jgi:hypothetical protein
MNFRNLLFISALLAPLSVSAQSLFPISLGVKGGAALTDAFSDRTFAGPGVTTRTYSPERDYVVGPMLELRLPMGVSVEADALYRPLHLNAIFTAVPGAASTTSRTVNSWEFPILAKLHMPFPILSPYIAAGPSFRHVSEFAGNSPSLSTKGVAAGVGIDARLLFLRVSPEFRYTHWGSDSNRTTSSFNPNFNSNQVEFLVGLSF